MKVTRKIAVFGSLALGISGLLVGLRTYEKYAAERKKLSNVANETRVKADQGDAAAQYKLARFYYQGKGVSKDYSEAFRWYRKAADKGYAKADFSLGEMYYRGEGVPKDLAASCSRGAGDGLAPAPVTVQAAMPKRVLRAFTSDQELRTYLKDLADKRKRRMSRRASRAVTNNYMVSATALGTGDRCC